MSDSGATVADDADCWVVVLLPLAADAPAAVRVRHLLKRAFRGWCETLGERDVMSQRAFADAMTAGRWERGKTNGYNYYIGLRVESQTRDKGSIWDQVPA